MKAAYLVFVITACFVTAAWGDGVGEEVAKGLGGVLLWWIGGAALLIVLGAPVLTVYMLIGRLMLKPTVTELKRINISLSGLQRGLASGVPDQVNQVAQQLYHLREALGSKTTRTPAAK